MNNPLSYDEYLLHYRLEDSCNTRTRYSNYCANLNEGKPLSDAIRDNNVEQIFD